MLIGFAYRYHLICTVSRDPIKCGPVTGVAVPKGLTSNPTDITQKCKRRGNHKLTCGDVEVRVIPAIEEIGMQVEDMK